MPNFFDNLWVTQDEAVGENATINELDITQEDLSDLGGALENITSELTAYEDNKQLQLHHYFSLRAPADFDDTTSETGLARTAYATFKPEYNFHLRNYEEATTSTPVNIEPLLPNMYVFGFFDAAQKNADPETLKWFLRLMTLDEVNYPEFTTPPTNPLAADLSTMFGAQFTDVQSTLVGIPSLAQGITSTVTQGSYVTALTDPDLLDNVNTINSFVATADEEGGGDGAPLGVTAGMLQLTGQMQVPASAVTTALAPIVDNIDATSDTIKKKHAYFEKWKNTMAKKDLGSLGDIRAMYENVVLPATDMTLFNSLSQQKELFPMAVNISFSTDTQTEFAELLKKAKLSQALMEVVFSPDSVASTEELKVRTATGDQTTTLRTWNVSEWFSSLGAGLYSDTEYNNLIRLNTGSEIKRVAFKKPCQFYLSREN